MNGINSSVYNTFNQTRSPFANTATSAQTQAFTNQASVADHVCSAGCSHHSAATKFRSSHSIFPPMVNTNPISFNVNTDPRSQTDPYFICPTGGDEEGGLDYEA